MVSHTEELNGGGGCDGASQWRVALSRSTAAEGRSREEVRLRRVAAAVFEDRGRRGKRRRTARGRGHERWWWLKVVQCCAPEVAEVEDGVWPRW
ncbi:hypothetical protein SESBI_48255 [Sesbania bispinosa]|nr:hypothetical protein SESBI_48255 [Sesbania bispinosa]